MEFLLVLAILVVVVIVVTAPLRRAGGTEIARDREPAEVAERQAAEVAELEAAREAKYREIRDAELDHRTGKLSDPDYEAVDRSLRAAAIEILRALDRARAGAAPPPSGRGGQ
ncbi:MAG: hypothetical protein ACR2IP_08075 [Solirubrobacteraceae bacterium]